MKTEDIDKLFNDYYEEDTSRISLPYDPENRLDQLIDDLDAKEKSLSIRRIWISIGSVAASIAIIISGIHFYNKPKLDPEFSMESTIQDPYEAYAETQKALALLSVNFNKGLKTVGQVETELHKTNQILYKIFNKQNNEN